MDAIIRSMENDLVELLIKFYPTKLAEVKKYLRLAGYECSEIPGLLDRTVGRNPKAVYLYKEITKKETEHGI